MVVTDEYTVKLENVIKQMLKPIKGIPFSVIIESISGYKVLRFDHGDANHNDILAKLIEVAKRTCTIVNNEGIRRTRPNEVGNDIEQYVVDALHVYNFNAHKPSTKSGKQQSVCYPDIEITTNQSQKHYIECKIYSDKTKGTSMRSFYLSPSEDFKVNHDAIHFIMGFEVYVDSRIGNDNVYKTNGWKILDAYQLECDVKHEFNSDNARLYKTSMVLAQGSV